MEASQARRHVRRADFRVGDWVIRPSLDLVSRGDKSVRVRPKLMDVLVYMTSRPGEVVSKDELLEVVWPQLFVDESALTIDSADAAVREGLEAAAALGEHYYEPELHRLRGEVLIAAGRANADAKRSFAESLRMAREQKAKSWELRTTISLARLWAGSGRAAQAHSALSAVCGWFTEGFTTPDLQAAGRLLQELQDNPRPTSSLKVATDV